MTTALPPVDLYAECNDRSIIVGELRLTETGAIEIRIDTLPLNVSSLPALRLTTDPLPALASLLAGDTTHAAPAPTRSPQTVATSAAPSAPPPTAVVPFHIPPTAGSPPNVYRPPAPALSSAPRLYPGADATALPSGPPAGIVTDFPIRAAVKAEDYDPNGEDPPF